MVRMTSERLAELAMVFKGRKYLGPEGRELLEEVAQLTAEADNDDKNVSEAWKTLMASLDSATAAHLSAEARVAKLEAALEAAGDRIEELDQLLLNSYDRGVAALAYVAQLETAQSPVRITSALYDNLNLYLKPRDNTWDEKDVGGLGLALANALAASTASATKPLVPLTVEAVSKAFRQWMHARHGPDLCDGDCVTSRSQWLVETERILATLQPSPSPNES